MKKPVGPFSVAEASIRTRGERRHDVFSKRIGSRERQKNERSESNMEWTESKERAVAYFSALLIARSRGEIPASAEERERNSRCLKFAPRRSTFYARAST